MNATQARFDYLRWLSRAAPDLYSVAMAHGETLGDYETLEGWADTIVSAITAVGGAVLAKKQADTQLKMQKAQLAADTAAQDAARADALRLALIQANTQRAAIGQPPVDMAGNIIPQSQLPAATPQMIAARGTLPTGFSFSSIPTWAYIAGAGALALLLVKR